MWALGSCQPGLHHLLPVWTQAQHLIALRSIFLTCDGKVVLPMAWSCWWELYAIIHLKCLTHDGRCVNRCVASFHLFFPSSQDRWWLISTKEVFCLVLIVSCSGEGISKVPSSLPKLKEWGTDPLLCYHKPCFTSFIRSQQMKIHGCSDLPTLAHIVFLKLGNSAKNSTFHLSWIMVPPDRAKGSIPLQFPPLLLITHPHLPHWLLRPGYSL